MLISVGRDNETRGQGPKTRILKGCNEEGSGDKAWQGEPSSHEPETTIKVGILHKVLHDSLRLDFGDLVDTTTLAALRGSDGLAIIGTVDKGTCLLAKDVGVVGGGNERNGSGKPCNRCNRAN